MENTIGSYSQEFVNDTGTQPNMPAGNAQSASMQGDGLLRGAEQGGQGQTVSDMPATAQPEAYDTLLGANKDSHAALDAAEQQLAVMRTRVENDQKRHWDGLVKEWKTELERDAELGGPYLAQNVARAQLALNRFDPDGVISTWLGTSGYGNHPDVLRFLLRISDALTEDAVMSGKSTGKKQSLEERMYGNWQP